MVRISRLLEASACDRGDGTAGVAPSEAACGLRLGKADRSGLAARGESDSNASDPCAACMRTSTCSSATRRRKMSLRVTASSSAALSAAISSSLVSSIIAMRDDAAAPNRVPPPRSTSPLVSTASVGGVRNSPGRRPSAAFAVSLAEAAAADAGCMESNNCARDLRLGGGSSTGTLVGWWPTGPNTAPTAAGAAAVSPLDARFNAATCRRKSAASSTASASRVSAAAKRSANNPNKRSFSLATARRAVDSCTCSAATSSLRDVSWRCSAATAPSPSSAAPSLVVPSALVCSGSP